MSLLEIGPVIFGGNTGIITYLRIRGLLARSCTCTRCVRVRVCVCVHVCACVCVCMCVWYVCVCGPATELYYYLDVEYLWQRE